MRPSSEFLKLRAELEETNIVKKIELDSVLKYKRLDKPHQWLIITNFGMILVTHKFFSKRIKILNNHRWHTAKQFSLTSDRTAEFVFQDGTIKLTDPESVDILILASQHVRSILTEEEFPTSCLNFDQSYMTGYGRKPDAVFRRMEYMAFIQQKRLSPNLCRDLTPHVRDCMMGKSNTMNLEKAAKFVSKFWLVFDGLLVCNNITNLIVPAKGTDVWHALAHFIEHNTTVESVVIKANPNSDPDGLKAFVDAFGKNKNCKVKTLQFAGSIYDARFAVMMAIIVESVHLKVWSVQTGFNRSGMETLSPMLGTVRGFANIQKVSFVKCEGIQCRSILAMAGLKVLVLSDSGIDLTDLFEALDQAGHPHISKICANGNVCRRELRSDLMLSPGLRALQLWRVAWHGNNLIRLFEIAANENWKGYGRLMLGLDGIKMEESGWKEFSEFVSDFHADPFQFITFSNNPLSVEFLRYLLSRSNLLKLQISGCIHEEDTELIQLMCEMLPVNRTLAMLICRGSNKKYMCEAVFKILRALIPNRALKILDVSNHRAGNEIVPVLLELLLQNGTLEGVVFDDNNIDDVDILFQLVHDLKNAPSPRMVGLNVPQSDLTRVYNARGVDARTFRKLEAEFKSLFIRPKLPKQQTVVKPPSAIEINFFDGQKTPSGDGVEVDLNKAEPPVPEQKPVLPPMYQVKVDRLNEEYVTDKQWESLLNHIPESHADVAKHAAYEFGLSSIALKLAL